MRSLPIAIAIAIAVAPAAPAAAEPEHSHDEGMYFRVGAGPGFAFARLFTAMDSNSTGVDVSTELAVGWAVRPGLIVGGGTFPMVVPSPSYDHVDAGGQHVSATGPFVDYYRDPKGGLHFQGGVLFTAGYLDGGDRSSHVGFGYGMMLGGGYDRYIGKSAWSVGGLARVTAYRLYGVDDSIRLASPSLLVTLTHQ
jgi:hypothetical protein